MEERKAEERKVPKWVKNFYQVIYNNWQHHAPCEHVSTKAEWDEDTKCWHIHAAPVWQEILGGEDDGKRVWAGFLFEFGDFSRVDGMWVQEQAFFSVCSECTPYPKTLTKGRFRGHRFYFHLLLEPPEEMDSVEVLDIINQEVRAIHASAEDEKKDE